MRCLDEATATALAGEATIPISGAWTCCFLVAACTAVLDFERASEWCDRIAEFAERYGSRYMLAFCRAEYGAVHLWRGRWAEAEAMLEASVEDFARSRPAWAAGPLVGLAELRRRQGRPAEAGAAARPGGHVDGGAALPRPPRARRGRRRGGGRAARAAAAPAAARARGSTARRRWSCSSTRVGARRARRAPARRSPSCASSRGWSARRRCGLRRPRRGLLAAARGEHDARARCSRTRSTASSAAARRSRPRRRGSRSPRASPRSAAPTSAEREAAAARRRALARARARAPRRGRGAAPASSPRGSARCSRLLAEGLTNRQIAERLVVSEHTVHRHVTNILRKLDLPSRRAAAAHAVRSGLSRSGHPGVARWPVRRSRRPRGASVGSWTEAPRASSPRPPPSLESRRSEATMELKATAPSTIWALGDYHRFATETVWELGPVLVDACGIAPGQRVLDVAAGTGNVAIRAAEAGADVVASDLTPENFEAGRARGPRPRRRARLGRGRRPGAARSPTASSTSSPPRSARCSRPTTRRSPTSCLRVCRPGRHDRHAQLHARRPGAATSSACSRRTCRRRRRGRCRRCSGATRPRARAVRRPRRVARP